LATVSDLLALDARVGTVVSARALRGARRSSFVLGVDFGAAGRRTAVVDGTGRDAPEELVGLQVIGVLNLPARELCGVRVDARVLSVDGGGGERALVLPERPVGDGAPLNRGEDEE
jgi:tRNA-binding protein